ncbi:AAA family ATPase (plasmid) [Nocardiopsis eucommiae]|uniref:AAA family ATPase n=1 Tax=Nocardiopsis eucommiae TaxID=2831970 RepID=A0A975LCL5_9ACTN|nr:AAA family ATPase [Nocardiopsis eucommiae]
MSNTARYTTTDVLAAERTISAHAQRRLHTGCAQTPPRAARDILDATERRQGFAFTPSQRHVLERLVEKGHGVDAVIGVAGAGKTTIMSAARQVWQAHGLRVGGASTAAVAAANLHAEAGIPSRTIASLLARLDRGQGLGDIDVLVLDEAAMIDDRALARLLDAANDQHVKVVGIGDPKQLRAVGVGGGFAAIHRHVEGLALDENMRQRVQIDRDALATWREGTDQARFSALTQWVKADRVHAGETTQDTHVAALAQWWKDTEDHPQTLDVIDNVLLLAGRNNDVEELNLRARSLFRYDERLKGRDVTFSLAGGSRIDLAKGDIVRVRANDYRSRRDPSRSDVLNGYRAHVMKVHHRHGALIQWRREGTTTQEWVSPTQIAQGHLSHGYAMTVAAAQGLTAQKAHVYGLGIDGHTLYSAMSRAKLRTDLYLPLNVLEDLEERAERGQARDGTERARRAVLAYAETINETDDKMVSEEPLYGPRRQPTTPEVANDPLGPNASELTQRRQALTDAVGALERVEHAADAVVRAGEEVRALEERASRGRLSLFREGSSRVRERARLDQARQVLEQSRQLLEQERHTARGHAAQAGVTADADTIRSAHGALTRDWDQLWAKATRKDQAETRPGTSARAPKPTARPTPKPTGKPRAETPEPPTPKRS